MVMAKEKRTTAFKGKKRKSNYAAHFPERKGELKFLDTALGFTNIAATGTITSPTFIIIPQGVTQSGRVGRQVTLKSVHISGFIELRDNTGVTSASNRVRMIVYLDKQCNGATATVTGLISTTDVDSFRNLQETNRFVFLSDKLYTLNATGSDGTSTLEYQKSFKVNANVNIPVEYSGTTGVLTEIRSNNLGIMLIADSAPTNATRVQYITRVRYTDM